MPSPHTRMPAPPNSSPRASIISQPGVSSERSETRMARTPESSSTDLAGAATPFGR